MDKLFLVDEKRKLFKTYQELFNDLSQYARLTKIINEKTPYEIFLAIVRSIISGETFELLDPDLSQAEIQRLGVQEQLCQKYIELKDVQVRDEKSLFDHIEKGCRTWRLGLYTSGTTGRPKVVFHSYDSLSRNLRMGDKHRNDVWAFCYNPTHIAGIQVFLQAFVNLNTIVYVFDVDHTEVPNLLEKYRVTHISATPTFYRSILVTMTKPIETVKRVTFGGEKFDPTILASIQRCFPRAKIINTYASTEAGTVLVSNGELFEVEDRLKNLIRVAEDGELLIHKPLIGQSVELKLEGDWYHTGDLVETTSDGKLRFIGRKSEMINVGGYKVNPNEVEEERKKVEGVIDAHVYARKNVVTGNIVVADVVKADFADEKALEIEIHRQLESRLQRWKIPRILNFVSEIKVTRTGKKVRQ